MDADELDAFSGVKISRETRDLLQATTFLEVIVSGSFGGAAARLGVSQAAVSMRIQALESQLGCALFTRGRGGVRLTPAGVAFQRHATIMKQVWDQAMLELALPAGAAARVRLGGHPSLWRKFLLRWLGWMRQHGAAFALQVEAQSSDTILQNLSEGMLDVGVLFDPHQLAGFIVEHLFSETLVLVATDASSTGPNDPSYLFVDWGAEFRKFHLQNFPKAPIPTVQTNLGAAAVEYILETGGTGYLPAPVVEPHLAAGRLHVLEGAPQYKTPIYAVYREGKGHEGIGVALDGLRAIAGMTRAD